MFFLWISSAMSANTPALDPEEFVQCPYEENHKVRNKRWHYHIVQCRRVSLQTAVFAFHLDTFQPRFHCPLLWFAVLMFYRYCLVIILTYILICDASVQNGG